jgi:hypothetical protein
LRAEAKARGDVDGGIERTSTFSLFSADKNFADVSSSICDIEM